MHRHRGAYCVNTDEPESLIQFHRRECFRQQRSGGLHRAVFQFAVVELGAAAGTHHGFIPARVGRSDELTAAALRTLNAEIHDPPR